MNGNQTQGILPESSGEQGPSLFPGEIAEGALLLCMSEDLYVTRKELLPTLRATGFEVDLFEVSQHPPPNYTDRPYKMVVLDISNADGAGYEMCTRFRNVLDVPLILVLRGAARNDVLRGYQAGADAYVLAPFDHREFTARMRALLRRHPDRPPHI